MLKELTEIDIENIIHALQIQRDDIEELLRNLKRSTNNHIYKEQINTCCERIAEIRLTLSKFK